MSINQLVAFFKSLPLTVWTFLTRPHPPLVPITVLDPSTSAAPVDQVATIAKWLLSQTESLGPMPRTGGVIHAINAATATDIATLVVKYAKQYDFKPSLLVAYINQESKGDPKAIDPNNQISKPGETSLQKFEHSDIGLVQIDGSTLESMPELAGKSVSEMEADAENPEWAIVELCEIITRNGRAIASAVQSRPDLLDRVPNRDIRIPKANAYNAGVQGTIEQLLSETPNLAYGQSVVATADKISPLVDVA